MLTFTIGYDFMQTYEVEILIEYNYPEDEFRLVQIICFTDYDSDETTHITAESGFRFTNLCNQSRKEIEAWIKWQDLKGEFDQYVKGGK